MNLQLSPEKLGLQMDQLLGTGDKRVEGRDGISGKDLRQMQALVCFLTKKKKGGGMRLWIRIFFCFKSKIAKNCKSLTIFYKSLIPLGLKKVHYYTSILYPFSLSILAFHLVVLGFGVCSFTFTFLSFLF